MKAIILISLAFLLSGCAEMYENRSFVKEMDHETDGIFVAGRDFNVVPGDGPGAYRSEREIQKRTPPSGLNEEQRTEFRSIQRELSKKEANLSPREYQDWQQIRRNFESPSQQIYYLNLSRGEKREYLSTNFNAEDLPTHLRRNRRKRGNSRAIASIDPRGYADKEIIMGMRKTEVEGLWGRPARVDVAGNPTFQNERWSFYENGRMKQVFFEGGRVQGWHID